MKSFLRSLLALCCLIGLSSCNADKDRVFKKSKILMNTLVTVTVVSNSGEEAEKAIDAAFSEIERIEKLADFFSPDSEITAVNKHAGISALKVSPDIVDLINKAYYVSEETRGAFDSTIGPVISLYDFQERVRPDENSIKEKLPSVNYKKVIIERNNSTVFLTKRGMLIDLGGIAKGFAADKAVDILKRKGINAGIVAVAGDIKTFGHRPDGSAWRIGIRNPRAKDDDDVIATIELNDMAISTSGDYERFFISDGRRYHHILSPKTGYPAMEYESVTVIAKEGAFTDAFATGVFVLGPSKGLKILEKMGFEGIIVDSRGGVHTTPGIRGKIEFKKTH